MGPTSPLATLDTKSRVAPTRLDLLSRRIFLQLAQRLKTGRIRLVERGGETYLGESDSNLTATLQTNSPRFFSSLRKSSVGVGYSYMKGEWDTDDLVALIRLYMRNLGSFDSFRMKMRPVVRPVKDAIGWARRNTPRRSRGQISYHYDLGNKFFELFLDPTMMYSCAVYGEDDFDLHQAQTAKIDRICQKLQLQADDHLVEIGTGWGSFACHAASEYGCKVTTTTISKEQHARALERVNEAGLSERIAVLLSDYRDLEGTYDKLVSIEMIEAVGWQYLDAFFGKCSELLKPDGLMALQAITISEQRFDDYKNADEFIKRFIFPGGCLVSIEAMMRSVRKSTDLRAIGLEDLTAHYARTLNDWRINLYRNLEPIRELGYDQMFLRMWEFYLAACEAGFSERRIGDAQMVFAKPEFRGEVLNTIENPAPVVA